MWWRQSWWQEGFLKCNFQSDSKCHIMNILDWALDIGIKSLFHVKRLFHRILEESKKIIAPTMNRKIKLLCRAFRYFYMPDALWRTAAGNFAVRTICPQNACKLMHFSIYGNNLAILYFRFTTSWRYCRPWHTSWTSYLEICMKG